MGFCFTSQVPLVEAVVAEEVTVTASEDGERVNQVTRRQEEKSVLLLRVIRRRAQECYTREASSAALQQHGKLQVPPQASTRTFVRPKNWQNKGEIQKLDP